MELILILMATVSVLTFLSGLITFFGARKGDRARSAWFFASAVFATVWMISIAIFMTAKEDRSSAINWHANWIFVSAILIDVAFLGYNAWKKKHGKALTIFFALLGALISVLIFALPKALYTEIVFSNTGNSVNLVMGPLYILYLGYFCLIIPVIAFSLLRQYFKTSPKHRKNGDLITMIAFAISSVLITVSEIILPIMGNWSIIWLGPLALSITIIAFYYTILRYKVLNLSSTWLKIFSYIVIITSIAIVYMLIFSLVFSAIFRSSPPSTEVIVLNFIMIMIFLLLMPAMNELTAFIKSLISDQTTKTNKEK